MKLLGLGRIGTSIRCLMATTVRMGMGMILYAIGVMATSMGSMVRRLHAIRMGMVPNAIGLMVTLSRRLHVRLGVLYAIGVMRR